MMMHARRRDPSGFTMVELMVVIAILAILIGLLAWGISKVRAAANQTTCINNMRQIALAVQAFHENNGKFPTYNGIFPSTGDTSQTGNSKAVYGSYLVHLLPFIDAMDDYKAIVADVNQYTNTGKPLTTLPPTPGTPGTPGVISVPAVPASGGSQYNTSGLTYIPAVAGVPATYNTWNSIKVGTVVSATQSGTQNGGVTILSGSVVWSPPQFPDLGTGIPGVAGYYVNAAGSTVSPPLNPNYNPGSAAIYSVPPTPPTAPIPGRSTYTGTFKMENRTRKHTLLLCPSDPSPGTDPNAPSVGVLYPTNGGIDYWSATNYLANWNAISLPDRSKGYKASSQDKSAITDGLSNTVLLAEAYAYCEGMGRTAYVAWHEPDPTYSVPNGGAATLSGSTSTPYGGVHNFGLTYTLSKQLKVNNRPAASVVTTNGYPNPSGSPELIFEFQVTPLPFSDTACPAGGNCCSNLTVQSGHASGINVAMADGSVHTLRSDMNIATWRGLLLPADGQAITEAW
jgi:prepilin-type N-terminal cleavage/methylation domain-containing protein/prepilin-type processing-associated H-X9-DG protein